MKLLSFATVTSVGRTRHLGALVSGDADSGEIIDLTAASRALLASEGLDEIGAERITNALCVICRQFIYFIMISCMKLSV